MTSNTPDLGSQQAVKCGERKVQATARASMGIDGTPDRRVLQQVAWVVVRDKSRYLSLPHVLMSRSSAHSHAMRAVPLRPRTGPSTQSVGEWTDLRHAELPWPPRELSVVLRTCVRPVSIPLGVRLRHALYCAVAALPYVMRGLWEERIASRRRIRVVRGRIGHMERVLALLARLRLRLRLRLWLWLCRRRIARIRVGGSGRRLVVWVVDQMAIWRARERCGLAGVHGVVCQLCSSSSRANLRPRLHTL